ncbi:MAG TPA: HAMP domain-containing sensor histidine kinase [Gaiellaceae bacterium]|nr:HAMP domain-containing sensor histidine kinase [Gaiellaceae bacterium]
MTGESDAARLAILVHEVRSPVAALAVIGETLSEGRVDAAARRELVRLVVAACRAIERLVTDASMASVRWEAVDVERLLHDARATATLRGARVRALLGESASVVDADPLRLRQALDNLLANAFAHSPAGAEVVLSASTAGDEILLSVSDSGPGIPVEEQERIFEPGVRLHSGYPGSGFGLAVSRAIAEAHGGRLTVESTPGHGTTFTLALPRRR